MRDPADNHYARAFENYLLDHRLKFVAVDQQKRTALANVHIKSLDFIVHTRRCGELLIELKGRRFTGISLTGLTNLQNWVGIEDVEGMSAWQKVFDKSLALFVFAYMVVNVDIDTDGRQLYEFDNCNYLFLAADVNEYRRLMKRRSTKWRTVYLAADDFRNVARPFETIIA